MLRVGLRAPPLRIIASSVDVFRSQVELLRVRSAVDVSAVQACANTRLDMKAFKKH